MLSLKDSLAVLKKTKALLEGHFVLSSGLHSPQYVQCAKLLSLPKASNKFTLSLSKKIKKHIKNIDIILSPAMGGIIIGYEIGKILDKETIFSERVNGEFKLRRDFRIKKGSKVLIVEDVITTGKSSAECSKLVEKAEAQVVGFACIIDRSKGNSLLKNKIVSQLELDIPTYTKDDLPQSLSSIEAIKPGSRNL
jgi:orotate phosphoribosyltransferase